MKWKIVQSCLKPPTRIGIYWDYLWDVMGCMRMTLPKLIQHSDIEHGYWLLIYHDLTIKKFRFSSSQTVSLPEGVVHKGKIEKLRDMLLGLWSLKRLEISKFIHHFDRRLNKTRKDILFGHLWHMWAGISDYGYLHSGSCKCSTRVGRPVYLPQNSFIPSCMAISRFV